MSPPFVRHVNPVQPLEIADQNVGRQPDERVLSSPIQLRVPGRNAENRFTLNPARDVNGKRANERPSHEREKEDGGQETRGRPEKLRPLSQLFSHPGNHEILSHVMRLLPRQDLVALQQVTRNTAWVSKNDAASQVRLERHRYRIPTPPEGSADVSLDQWQQEFASRSCQRPHLVSEVDKTRLAPVSDSAVVTVQGGLAVTIDLRRAHDRADHWTLTTLPDRPLMSVAPPTVIIAPTDFDQLLVCAPDDAVFTVRMSRMQDARLQVGEDSPVTIEIRPFLLRRSSIGPATVHPEARFAIMVTVVPVITWHDYRHVIRVRCGPGGLLAILCPTELRATGRQTLYVIDWKQGVCLGVYYPHTACTRYRSILFIGKNRLLCGGVRTVFGGNIGYQPVLDVLDWSPAHSFGLVPYARHPTVGRLAPPRLCATLRICASFTLPVRRPSHVSRSVQRGVEFTTAAELWHEAQDDLDCARSLQLSGSTLDEARVATFWIGHGCAGVAMLSGLLDLIDEHHSRQSVDARSPMPNSELSRQDAKIDALLKTVLQFEFNGTTLFPTIEWEDWRHYAYLEHERDTIAQTHLASGSRVCTLVATRRDGVVQWRLEMREFNTRIHELLLNQPNSTWTAGTAPRKPDELGRHEPARLRYVRKTLTDGSIRNAAESTSTMPFPVCWDNGHILVKEVDIRNHVEPPPVQGQNFSVLHITNEPRATIDDDAMSSIAALMGDVPYEDESP